MSCERSRFHTPSSSAHSWSSARAPKPITCSRLISTSHGVGSERFAAWALSALVRASKARKRWTSSPRSTHAFALPPLNPAADKIMGTAVFSCENAKSAAGRVCGATLRSVPLASFAMAASRATSQLNPNCIYPTYVRRGRGAPGRRWSAAQPCSACCTCPCGRGHRGSCC